MAIKTALSTDNVGQAAAALQAIRSLLEANGFDLHDLSIVVESASASQAA